MGIHVATYSVIGVVLTLLASPQQTELPEYVKLADVEIQAQSGGGDGCARLSCSDYRITLRGDGFITLEDLGWGPKHPPRQPTQKRPLGEDEFVLVLNQLLEARFLDAPAEFPPTRVAMRKDELLYFYRHSKGSGAGWLDLTLRAGSYQKTLRVGNRDMTPVELRRVKEQIWTLGGPDAWR